MKRRIDLLLVDKALANSRTKAQEMIEAGCVYIENRKIIKSGELHDENIDISINKFYINWVSRGALKLLHALDSFSLDVSNFTCLDIGASTGGFTEVLLSKNVKKIYAVDVGSNQLNKKLLNNSKVINLQQTNAKSLNREIISDVIDIIVCDVSFISMKKVIKPALSLKLSNTLLIIALIKPQFEANRREVRKGGVITDPLIHERICNDYKEWFSANCNMRVIDIIPSPIKRDKGNIEFLIYVKK